MPSRFPRHKVVSSKDVLKNHLSQLGYELGVLETLLNQELKKQRYSLDFLKVVETGVDKLKQELIFLSKEKLENKDAK